MRRRQEFRVHPVDIKKNTALGLKLPFNGSKLFDVNYTTLDQLKSNLLNFLLTSTYERPFNLNYGAGLRDLLFEPFSSTEELRERVIDKVSLYFPEITVKSLDISKNEDANYLYVKMVFLFNNTEDKIEVGVQNTNGQ